MNKFSGCPEVYYISHEKYTDRHHSINSLLNSYNIPYTPVITTKDQDNQLEYVSAFPHQNEDQAIKVTASHLRAIKQWVETTNTDMALFFEDDISFDTVEYWDLDLKDFIDSAPEDWDCLQLMLTREYFNQDNFYLKHRYWDDWAITAYVLKREYAQKIVSLFYPRNNFINLILPEPNQNVIGLPENIIYLTGTTYTFPLFVENISLQTTFLDNVHYDKYNQFEKNDQGIIQKCSHINSYNIVLNWWKNKRGNA